MSFLGFRKPYEYVVTVDPDSEWRSGFFGFALRLRSIAATFVLQVAIAISTLFGEVPHIAFSMVVLIIALSIGFLFYIRRTRLARVYAD